MTFVWLALLGLAVLLLYCIQMIHYGSALKKRQQQHVGLDAPSPFLVTLVIPLRNEMDRMETLLASLAAQDLPSTHYEVIFADDHSGDGSGAFLEQICQRSDNYRYIGLEEHQSGKKQAIDAAYAHAKGAWIIQTDADCVLPKSFLSGHAAMAKDSGAELIAGPVLAEPAKGIWNKIESVELMSLTGTGMASFLLGKPVMCSGANLSYSRNFYEEVRNVLLDIPSASGDDIFLMLQARKRNKKVAFLGSADQLVMTAPTGSLLTFFRQRVRWGSKTRLYADSAIVALSVLVWTTNTVVTLALIGSFFDHRYAWLFAGSWVFKSAVDFRLLYHTAKKFHRTELLRWFPLAAIFYYFYITLAGLFSVFGKYRWKDRNYSPGIRQVII